MVPTDKTPVQLWYVPSLDQVWVLNWRDEDDIGVKTVQVIEYAAQKKKHRAVRPEPIDAQFDVIQNIYIPEPQVDEASVWSLPLATDPRKCSGYFRLFRISNTRSSTVT